MRDFCGFGASDFFDFGDSGARNTPPRFYLCIMLPRGWLLRAVEGLLGRGATRSQTRPLRAATGPTSSYLTSPSRVLNNGGI